jgi:uncharacterized membrane protein YbhN (UPF0104 family)
MLVVVTDAVLAEPDDAGATPMPPSRRQRIVRLIIRMSLLSLAVLAMTSLLSGIDFHKVIADLRHASPWLLLLGFVLANLTRVTQATSTLGAAPEPLPFGPVYALQLAMSFITVAVPSYAARVAVSIRFYQKRSIATGAALAAGALDVMTTFLIEVIGIFVLVVFTSASLDVQINFPSDSTKRLVIIAAVIAVVAFVVLAAVAKWRRFVVEWIRRLAIDAWAAIRGLKSPRRLALLLGGNLGTELLFTLALGTFAHAMGTTVPFADLLLIHLSVSLLAGLVPIPGGVGVAEALLTYGLIRSGMTDDAAFAAVIAYRASTFYLPPIWGYMSLRWLQHRDMV